MLFCYLEAEAFIHKIKMFFNLKIKTQGFNECVLIIRKLKLVLMHLLIEK